METLGLRLTINGKLQEVRSGQRVGDLLRDLGVPPVRVAVELNEDLVPRAEFDRTSLRDGDRLEIVTLVGGG